MSLAWKVPYIISGNNFSVSHPFMICTATLDSFMIWFSRGALLYDIGVNLVKIIV